MKNTYIQSKGSLFVLKIIICNSIFMALTLCSTALKSQTYCPSKGVAPWELWISNVQLNTINNTSEKFKDFNTFGYSDYTNLSTTMAKNRPYQLTVTPSLSWIGYLPNVYCRVWLDFNGNKTFESTELVFEGTNRASFLGNMTVPATAIEGDVRMRVAVKWGGYPEPCEAFARGEVEDYTINLQGISTKWINAAVQNWSVPQIAMVGQTQNSTFDLTSNGTLPLSNVLVGAFLSSDNLWGPNDVLIGTMTSPPIGIQTLVEQVLPFTIPANTTAGNYFIILKADYTEILTEVDETDNTIVKPFVVQTSSANYCASKGTAPWELWIAKVQFETINYTSDKFKDFNTLGYSDYTNLSTTVTRGMTTVLTVTPGLSWSGYLPNVYCRAWIDYNGNKTFEASELIFQNTNVSPFTGAIRVPNALATTARMRVALKWGSYPEPCETFERGEVEDYTLNFQTGGAIINPPILELEAIKEVKINDFNAVKVFPNPASDDVSIVLKNYDNTEAKVLLYNSLGLVVKTFFLNKSNTTLIKTGVNDLPNGQYYVRIVAAGKPDAVQRFLIVR